MTFTFDQAHAYYVTRLSEPNLPHRNALTTRCPFHGDRTASLSIDLSKGGVWNCHACNVGGGLYDFEKRMFGEVRDNEQLWEWIYKLTGATPVHDGKERRLGPVVATYAYVDPDGKLLFEKQRHEPKTFTQRAKVDGKLVYSLTGVAKVLYRLPEVMAAKIVFVVEGEKDADALTAALGGSVAVKDQTFSAAVTCNFDGAGKWKDEYSAFFAGRRVVILPDNDAAGVEHGAQVAASAVRFAQSVKVVNLQGLPDKGDVSDFLQSHTVQDLLIQVGASPRYHAPCPNVSKPFFVPPAGILAHSRGVEWIIPGVIHRGAKGLIVAQPKAGKSMIALDLAVALSSGQPWMEMAPTQPVRTAVVSREDGPSMTMHRLQQFAKGRGLDFSTLSLLHVNTFEQKASFSIENDDDLQTLCEAITAEGIELCIFDVLNKLHSSDENDNTKMTAVMGRFDLIRAQTGADTVVIHHDAKNSAQGGGKKPRGASSIDSWWDWKVSISISPEDDARKEVFFASKAGQPHASITVAFQNHLGSGVNIVPVVA